MDRIFQMQIVRYKGLVTSLQAEFGGVAPWGAGGTNSGKRTAAFARLKKAVENGLNALVNNC